MHKIQPDRIDELNLVLKREGLPSYENHEDEDTQITLKQSEDLVREFWPKA